MKEAEEEPLTIRACLPWKHLHKYLMAILETGAEPPPPSVPPASLSRHV